MKIGQGQSASSIIEQMQKAHAESVEKASSPQGTRRSFSIEQAPAAGEAATPTPAAALDQKVVRIAERVLKGELTEPSSVRKEVLHAIVDERYGDMMTGRKKRLAMKALEHTMVDDPSFSREVDRMLVLAARQATSTTS